MPVPYAEIRNEIRSGDLFASRSDHWKAKLVRWWTKSPFSHVATMQVEHRRDADGGRRVVIFEAVLAETRSYALSKEKRFWWIPSPVLWTRAAELFALDAMGEQYSQRFAVQAGLGFRMPTMDGKWQCAELTRQIQLRSRLPAGECRWDLANAPETPAGIVAWALKHNGNRIVEVVNE